MGCYLQLRSVLLPQEQVARALYPKMTRGIGGSESPLLPACMRACLPACVFRFSPAVTESAVSSTRNVSKPTTPTHLGVFFITSVKKNVQAS
jgi:hypothetical protein